MASQARARYEIKIADVQSLLEIHSEQGGTGRGRRKTRLRVLHKAAIALLVAAWETYIETVLEEAAMALLTEVFLSLSPPASRLKKKRNWIQDQQDLIKVNVQQVTKRFNTADSRNVKQLFSSVLGIANICIKWNRQGMDWEKAKTALDQLLAERHRIVHGSTVDPEYSKTDVSNWRAFITITVNRTDDAIGDHLHSLTGKFPW